MPKTLIKHLKQKFSYSKNCLSTQCLCAIHVYTSTKTKQNTVLNMSGQYLMLGSIFYNDPPLHIVICHCFVCLFVLSSTLHSPKHDVTDTTKVVFWKTLKPVFKFMHVQSQKQHYVNKQAKRIQNFLFFYQNCHVNRNFCLFSDPL